jgi:hypothetical protein
MQMLHRGDMLYITSSIPQCHGKRPQWRTRRRREDNIKTNLEMGISIGIAKYGSTDL